MASKQQIKEAFVTELTSCSQYAECLLLKQALLNEIAAPNINHQITYTFTQELTDQELQTFSICFKMEFGWMPEFVTNKNITVSMVKFFD